MKLLIVLCLGTLALSAPAPQKRNQIDFLYDDDEIQASVRPVEINTVEPKVTATKISDPREPAPVFENEEKDEEEEVSDQEKEPSPIASPLNLEQNASENDEPIFDETDNDDLESLNNTSTSTTDSAVTDTTIRVYDEDEVNEPTENKERPDKEQENKQEHDQEKEHDWDQEQVNAQENDQEIDQEDDKENDQKIDQEKEKENEWEQVQHQARNNQINQKAVLDDSYQYDDESLEREKGGSEKPFTEAPEPNAEKPGLNGVLSVELNHETQVVEKGNFDIQDLKTPLKIPVESENREYAGFDSWDTVHRDAVTNDGMSVELKSGQLFNHGTLILEKGTFEGQDMNHPFTGPFPMKQWKMGERPEFDNWHHGPHGPHGHRGHHGHPNFPGLHNEHHRFEGPPPPWVQRPHFHAHHFDHKSHEHKGYNFHGNGFQRDMPTWNNHWENPDSVPPTSGSPTETVLSSE